MERSKQTAAAQTRMGYFVLDRRGFFNFKGHGQLKRRPTK
jgi:hypothetical protein